MTDLGRRAVAPCCLAERTKRMPHAIDPALCASCGVCMETCPSEAISEGTDSYVIDAELCTDCASCASECPSEAISAQ